MNHVSPLVAVPHSSYGFNFCAEAGISENGLASSRRSKVVSSQGRALPARLFERFSCTISWGRGLPSALLQRFSFTVNWERMLVASNITLITAGIAYGFFMRLPAIAVGLASYGLFYLSAHQKAQQSALNTIDKLRNQLQAKEGKVTGLREELQESYRESGSAKGLGQQVAEQLKEIASLKKKNKALDGQVGKYKEKIKSLEQERNNLKVQNANLTRQKGDFELALDKAKSQLSQPGRLQSRVKI